MKSPGSDHDFALLQQHPPAALEAGGRQRYICKATLYWRTKMQIDRRDLLGRAALAVIAGATAGLAPSLSRALSEDEASAHVRITVSEILALVRDP